MKLNDNSSTTTEPAAVAATFIDVWQSCHKNKIDFLERNNGRGLSRVDVISDFQIWDILNFPRCFFVDYFSILKLG